MISRGATSSANGLIPQATWDNLQLGLRLGDRPRALVTTTPRPVPLLRALIADPSTAVTRGGTAENLALPSAFVAAVTEMYGGTRYGRQELGGELIEDVAGALWTRAMLELCRARALPEVTRVVVGVDPPVGSAKGPTTTGGDACGIVVAALGCDGHGYVIEDASVPASDPAIWARAVASAAARHGADRVVAEGNNGGDMVTAVLRAADATLPVVRVTATRGKAARAEPIALLYTRGAVHHIGAFPALEDELCGLIAGGRYEGPGRSPDRADACVWAAERTDAASPAHAAGAGVELRSEERKSDCHFLPATSVCGANAARQKVTVTFPSQSGSTS